MFFSVIKEHFERVLFALLDISKVKDAYQVYKNTCSLYSDFTLNSLSHEIYRAIILLTTTTDIEKDVNYINNFVKEMREIGLYPNYKVNFSLFIILFCYCSHFIS